MVGKKITGVYKQKLIILSDPSVNRDFFLTHQIVNKLSTGSNKNIIGVDIYKSTWQSLDGKYEIQFFLSDISTSPSFEAIRPSLLIGASGCILIFEYTCSDLLLNLEKWITEVVLTCGNVPIVLIGKNLKDLKRKSKKTEIEVLVENKRTSWGLSIEKFDMLGKGSEIEEVINAIGDLNIDRIKNPKLRELQVGTLENLESLLINESDIDYIREILYKLSKSKKKSTSILLYTLTTGFFEQLLHTQEQLVGLPALLSSLRLIDLQFTRTLIENLSFENLIEKIDQEKNLREINLLLDEFSIIDIDFLVKFLTKISTNLLSKKIAQAWIDATITASWSHSAVMQLIQATDSGDTQTYEVIRFVSEVDQERKKKETLFEISSLLAKLYPVNKTKTLDILGEIKNQISELAKKVLNEDDNTLSENHGPLKSSLEIGAYTKKEAARREITSGLSELDIVNISLQEISLDDRISLINEITIDNIHSKIEAETKLTTIYEFLKTISKTDSKLLQDILNRIEKLLRKKIENESSIIVIRKLLELIKHETPGKLPEIIRNLTIENWINKMILHYANLSLETIDIPLLLSFSVNYGRERQFTIIQFLQHRYPDITFNDQLVLIELIFELVHFVKEDLIHDQEDISNQAMEIFDFFINTILAEILELLKIISKELEIPKTDIKKNFHSLLLTEEKKNFSYQKRRLFDFITNLPL